MTKLAHLVLYLAFILAVGAAAVLLYFFHGQPGRQLLVMVGMAAFYMVWGVLHHGLEGELDFEVLLDYLLIGGLVVVLFLLAMKF